MAGTLVYFYTGRTGKEETINLTNLSPEMRQTVYYYKTLSEEKIEKIKEMDELDKQARTKIIKEAGYNQEDLQPIIEDLHKFPDDERVKNAFIEYYRSRAEFLDYILEQMRDLNFPAEL